MEVALELDDGQRWEKLEVHGRNSEGCLEENGSRNMDVKGDSGESLKRKTDLWRKP